MEYGLASVTLLFASFISRVQRSIDSHVHFTIAPFVWEWAFAIFAACSLLRVLLFLLLFLLRRKTHLYATITCAELSVVYRPFIGRPCGVLAQSVRALACQARGRGFESRTSRHFAPADVLPVGAKCFVGLNDMKKLKKSMLSQNRAPIAPIAPQNRSVANLFDFHVQITRLNNYTYSDIQKHQPN